MTVTLHHALLHQGYQLEAINLDTNHPSHIYSKGGSRVYADPQSLENITLPKAENLDQVGTLFITHNAPITINCDLRTRGTVSVNKTGPFTCEDLILENTRINSLYT